MVELSRLIQGFILIYVLYIFQREDIIKLIKEICGENEPDKTCSFSIKQICCLKGENTMCRDLIYLLGKQLNSIVSILNDFVRI